MHSLVIATFNQEHTMTQPDNTELAGRIEAIGRALLRLTAELEIQRLIDGPRVVQAWQQAVPEHVAAESPLLHCARHCLHDMAQQLEAARSQRQSLSHQG